MVDARLPDGSRVNAVVPPLALDGSMLTIRKFAADPYLVSDLIGFGTLTAPVAELLRACVRGRLNIVISGGTGSGKTTTLNVLSSFVPDDERIVTIEDAAELQLRQEHVLRLEARPPNLEGRGAITIRDLVRNSLRMRPDRIIVGEVRDGAALDMLQAMNTGHDGSITTVHSNTPRDALARLETMVLMAGLDLPQRAIREQMASAINLIVHQARLKDGTRRITHITEVDGMEGDIVTLQDVYLFDFRAGVDEHGAYRGELRSTGLRPRFARVAGRPRRPRLAAVPRPAGERAMSEPALRWFTGAVTSGAAQRLPVSLIAGVGCVFLALLLASALLIGMVRPDDRAKRLADRIERYGSRHVAVRAGGPLARIAEHLVSPVLRSDTRARLELRLDLAGIGWDPAEWVLAGAGVSVALFLALTVLVGQPAHRRGAGRPWPAGWA